MWGRSSKLPSSLTTQTVKSVVENFGKKCGARDVKNASVFGRRSVAMAWSAHTLLLLAAIGIVLVCVGVLSWLAFRKSEPHTPSSTILLCVLALLAEFLDARI